MGVVLPSNVAIFLNFMGIPWINVDEDHVREAARHVRTFVTDLGGTLNSANARMSALQDDYSGTGYQQLLTEWAAVDRTHMSTLRAGGGVVAQAMDSAATTIAVLKAASIAEIAALLATAGALLVSGGAALEPLVAAAARRIVTALQHTIEEYIIGKVLEEALTRFEDVVQRFVEGIADFTYNATAALLDVPESAPTLHVNPDEARRHADALTALGDEITDHYSRFTDNLTRIGSDSSESNEPAVDLREPPATPNSPTEPTTPNPTGSGNSGHADPAHIGPQDRYTPAPTAPEVSTPENLAGQTSTDERQPQPETADRRRETISDETDDTQADGAGQARSEGDRIGLSSIKHASNPVRVPEDSDRLPEPSAAAPVAQSGAPSNMESDPDRELTDRRPERATDHASSFGRIGTPESSSTGDTIGPPPATAIPDVPGTIDSVGGGPMRDTVTGSAPPTPTLASGSSGPSSRHPWSRRDRQPVPRREDGTGLGSPSSTVAHTQPQTPVGKRSRTPWTNSPQPSDTTAPPAAISADPALRTTVTHPPPVSSAEPPTPYVERKPTRQVEAPAAEPPQR